MKYLIILIFSITTCFAEFEIIEAEYLDSIDNKKIQFHYVPFFFDDQFIFVNNEKNLNSTKSTDLFIMKDFKIQVIEGQKIINEIVEKDPTAILHNINDMVKDSKNNLWMLTSDCLLIKYDWKEFSIIQNLREFFKENELRGKSLAVDQNDNIYIHTEMPALLKYDGIHFEELISNNNSFNLSPNIQNTKNLINIENKLYFRSMKNQISYYDIEKNIYDSLDIKPLIGDTITIIYRIFKWKNKLIFSYGYNMELKLVSYDGLKFEDLSHIIKLIPHDFKKSVGIIHIDDIGRYYFTVADPDSVNYQRIYQVDTNLKVRLIDFYKNNKTEHLKNLISPTGVYILQDGRIVIPDISDQGGFYIFKQPSSVETPLNVLFVNRVYPNPAKTNVAIDFMVEPENMPNIKVELYNLTGVLQSKLDYSDDYNNSNGQGTLNCNIENIPNGYYIIVIDNGKRKIAKPFIVNRD